MTEKLKVVVHRVPVGGQSRKAKLQIPTMDHEIVNGWCDS